MKRLEVREDDTEEAVNRRLEQFHDNMDGVMDFLEEIRREVQTVCVYVVCECVNDMKSCYVAGCVFFGTNIDCDAICIYPCICIRFACTRVCACVSIYTYIWICIGLYTA